MLDLQTVLVSHAAWLQGRPEGARADLSGANLGSADLVGADLGGANLGSANLGGANLARADLVGANLGSANLGSASLRGADLRSAYLGGANLEGANLRDANLGGASLRDASLEGASLSGASLWSANLAGTCLDPAAPLPPVTDAELAAAGLEIDGPWVLGYRTRRSMHFGSTEYSPGSAHAAPWFSADASASCHPGLYLAGKAWLASKYQRAPIVRCRCLRAELLHAGDKWRAKRLWIQCEDGSWPPAPEALEVST